MQTPVSRVPPKSNQQPLQRAAPKPKLPDQERIALRSRHYSKSTEQIYVHWIKLHLLSIESVTLPRWERLRNFY